VSHSKERIEKVCLNCNAEVVGRYCHQCGQENIEPKESFWHLVSHFFNDITHFDGKFFTTVSLLFRKPGFLSKEYSLGRRMRYLNPVRMYVFTSFVFFLVFFSLVNVDNMDLGLDDKKVATDSVAGNSNELRDSLLTSVIKENSALKNVPAVNKAILDVKARNKKEYDSIQSTLPANERDGWLERQVAYREITIRDKYDGSMSKFGNKLLDKFLHTFPSLLFVSLPLLALFLKLLYIRNKSFYYTDHGIFLVHLYIFTFIWLLAMFGLSGLRQYSGWRFIGFLEAVLYIYGIYYAWKSMRNFYGQSRKRTTLKFIVFNLLSLISIILLFAVFMIITFFQV
jgi:hypothetical protein